ncbi:MAG: tetratricopeptide repeat protein, partial [Gammaproteobacteria bacterium]|nr:tetratricopeptide repeat protein [Gammaproteobacteria bacterium]
LRLWNNLAGLYRDRGQFDKALAVYTRVDERVRLTSPEGHIRRAYPRYGLGLTLNRLGRPEEAEPHLRAALELVQANGRESMIAVTRGELGDSLAAQGRIEAAQREYRAALVLYTEALGRDDDDPNVRALQLRLLNVP